LVIVGVTVHVGVFVNVGVIVYVGAGYSVQSILTVLRIGERKLLKVVRVDFHKISVPASAGRPSNHTPTPEVTGIQVAPLFEDIQ
jgi:hypothetical protein